MNYSKQTKFINHCEIILVNLYKTINYYLFDKFSDDFISYFYYLHFKSFFFIIMFNLGKRKN